MPEVAAVMTATLPLSLPILLPLFCVNPLEEVLGPLFMPPLASC
jgi:hypothetical protein